ncbi:MAG: nicotinate (nicotinamide) nucleotide adenylyltransferase [Ruminococcaceae bacterium]|nr:nicotinate (nicotinamide) nucleotide adenylyltransferase [Oscillospiraceae bacterium]
MKKKIGIFGGTFAPIHNAHIRIALEFKKSFDLDKLLIIPASIPPHKELPKGDSAEHRLNMLKLVFDNEEYKTMGIEVSDYELTKPGVSYTVETLEHFYSEDTELYLLCGTDMFLKMHHWRSPERIAELTNLVFTRREDSTPLLDKQIATQKEFLEHEYKFKIYELEMTAMELSSTYIRAHIDGDLEGLLNEKVLKYIKDNNLYRG